jgi:hypothetical protein
VEAVYTSGFSAKICQTFTSQFLYPPTQLVVQGSGDSAYLTWHKPVLPGGGTPPGLIGYNISRSQGGSAGPWVLIKHLVTYPDSLSWYDYPGSPNQWCYRVTSYYDLTALGFPGQFDESMPEGPQCLTLDRLLTNITIGPGATRCYNALHTITLAGNGTYFTVENGGDVTLIAGQRILFKPGTTVQQGGHLWAYITTNGTYCLNPDYPANTFPVPEEPVSETETSLFKVYPNPTTGKFTLELNAEPKEIPASIRIYSMMGKEVLRENLADNRKTEFSLTGRSAGIYIIRVMIGDRMATAKIVKH